MSKPYVLVQFKSLPPDQREWRIVATGLLLDPPYVLEFAGKPDAMGAQAWHPYHNGTSALRGEAGVPMAVLMGLAQLIDRAGK